MKSSPPSLRMREQSLTTVGDELMTGRVEESAASFGARGTPHSMRVHEIMGIEVNRRGGVCSLNDFREVCVITFFVLIVLYAYPEFCFVAVPWP